MSKPRSFISMRSIVSVATVLLISATVLVVGVISERHTRRTLTEEIRTRLRLQARNLALMSSSALLSEYPELTLHPLVKEMQADLPELALVLVLDHQGVIQGHPDARSLGQSWEVDFSLGILESDTDLQEGEYLFRDDQVLMASVPVLHPDGRCIGRAVVGLYREYIAEMVQAVRAKQLILIGALLLVGVLAALLLMSHLLRPLGALRDGLERIGRGDLDTPIQLQDRTELGLLAEAVNEMSAELKSAQSEMVEKERLAHEMELGREIQRSLLPAEDMRVGDFNIVGTHRAAAEVGGDYYDFFELPGDRIGLAIADVAGKGLAGCLIMSMLSALLRSHRSSFDSPAELLAFLDEELRGTLKREQFITMFYGILDPEGGRLCYASAAHSPLLVFRAATGEVEWRRTQGIPLGAGPRGALRKTLQDEMLDLAPGDLLVQYTDGVNEAFAPNEEQFDFTRIERCVLTSASQGSGAVLRGLRDAVRSWTRRDLPFDDETLLVLGREREADAAAESLLAAARSEGRPLELAADLDELARIRGWMADCPFLDELSPEDARLVESAVYEACANIVEHGYKEDPTQRLELWWLPGGVGDTEGAGTNGEGKNSDGTVRTGLADRLGGGAFIIRDHGPPFHAPRRIRTDLRDPVARRRGRGLGLDIIHSVVSRISYHPGSPEGNLTILRFGHISEGEKMEMSDVQ